MPNAQNKTVQLQWPYHHAILAKLTVAKDSPTRITLLHHIAVYTHISYSLLVLREQV